MEENQEIAALKARFERLKAFEGSLLRLAAESDPAKVLGLVAEIAASMIEAETLVIPTLSPDNLEVRYDYAYGKHKDAFLGTVFPIEDAGLCGWVLEKRRPILVNNLLEDPRVKKELARTLGINTALLVPLIARGRIIGGISAFNKTDGSLFNEEDTDSLTRLANYAAIAIDNARLMEALGTEKLKLTATLDSINGGIILLTKDGTIINVNKAMEQYLPMKVKEIVGTNVQEFASIKPLVSLFDWEAKAKRGKRCWEVFACAPDGCPVYETDLLRCWSYSGGHCRKKEYAGKEDKKIWELCAHCEVLAAAAGRLSSPREVQVMGKTLTVSSVIVIHESTKDIFGEVMVFRDISAEKLIERQRSEFISMITHDLKTPITSTMGYCELMQEENDPGKLRDMARAALKSSGRLMKMINDFLELSKAEAGKITLNLMRISPASFLPAIQQHFIPQALEKGVNLTWEVEEGAPDFEADLDQLNRIVGNLLSNALKYVPKGGNIRMLAHMSTRGLAAIAVEDDGPGIDPDELPRVFDAYYSGRIKNKDEGTGLGLAIVKVLTEAHGGTVLVRSEKGKGSTFTVLLPVKAA